MRLWSWLEDLLGERWTVKERNKRFRDMRDPERDRDMQGRQFCARHLAAVYVMQVNGVSDERIAERLYLHSVAFGIEESEQARRSAAVLDRSVIMWYGSYMAATARIGDGARERKRGGWLAECTYVAKAFGYEWPRKDWDGVVPARFNGLWEFPAA